MTHIELSPDQADTFSNTPPGKGINAFQFSSCQNILCEVGSSKKLGELCKNQGFHSALVITDAGIKKLGLCDTVLASLQQQHIHATLFTDVQADPAESVVLDALEQAKACRADVIIGFGGGSSMDVSKLVAFLAHPACCQSLSDIYGVNNARGNRLPLIQIPTTAGTGSEVTMVAIVTTGETTKMGAVSPIFLPDFAILDAELTLGLPPAITAATGIDAMVHAIEAFTSKIKKNPLSDLLAREALAMMGTNIKNAVHNGMDIHARENMLLGATLAGQAFANAPVAAVHALAYPLGGHFHIPHGLSNSLVLPHVMRFNISHAAEQYAQLASVVFPDHNFTGTSESISLQFVDALFELIKSLNLPIQLRQLDIPEAYLPKLAEDAMLQTRLLINNPRGVNYDDALSIYQAAY